MGMISFLKEAGEKLFVGKPAVADLEASAAIKTYINTQGLPGDDLNLSFNGVDQIVTVSGLVYSQEVREKVVICCGNVAGVAGVTDDIRCAEPVQACSYHIVVPGDSLSAISKRVYGNVNLHQQIFEANKPMLKSPGHIYPGQVLRIPAQA